MWFFVVMGSILETTFQGTVSMPDHSTGINISSNTLFHFTNSIDNLLNILRNEFSPHYCLEYLGESEWKRLHQPDRLIPLVSFCDLPLFLIKSHLKFYGSYGIGLTKDWGITRGVTPVYYVHKNSPLHEIAYEPLGVGDEDFGTSYNFLKFNQVWSTHDYAKLYQGPAWRKNEQIDDIRFYNEREWRFVPSEYYFFMRSGKEDITSTKWGSKIQEYDKALSERVRIPFGPDDIQYIIVRDANEILDMITQIEQIKGKLTWQQVRRLITTITTSERIRQDF